LNAAMTLPAAMAHVRLPWAHERVRRNTSRAFSIATAGFTALPAMGLAWRMRGDPRV